MKYQWRFGKQFLIIGMVMLMILPVLTGCGKTEMIIPETTETPTPTIQIVDAPEKMGAGDQTVIRANVENMDDAVVQWKSSDSTVAQVDADGTVHALQEGVVTITAQIEDLTDTVELSVLPHIREITLEESAITLLLGSPSATHAVAYQITPANVLEPGVQWTSSDPAIVSVDADGTLVAVASGSCTVTGKAVDTANEVADVTLAVNVEVGVSGITLSETAITGYVGKSAKLAATVLPEDAANKTIVWTSSDETVATVAASGSVKFLKPGEVTITCSAADGGGTSAQCVISSVQGTKKVVLDKKNVQLILGSKASAAQTDLTYTLTPEDTSFRDVTWMSSDETCATVDSNGKVTALKAGEVTITAVSTDPATNGTVKDTATIVVGEAVQRITLNDIGSNLMHGKSYALKAAITPENPLNSKLKWTSSDETVLKVDDKGKITVVGLGNATITAAATDGSDVTASATFTAIKPVKKISYEDTRIVVTEGKTFSVNVSVDPADASDKTVSWSSTDTSIATVDRNGVITAKSVGECEIIVSAQDGSEVTLKIPVVVEPEVPVETFIFVRRGYFGYYNEFEVGFENLTATKRIERIDFHLSYSYNGSTRTCYAYAERPIGPNASRRFGWWKDSGLVWGSNFKIYLDSVTYKDGTKDYYNDALIGWYN